MAIQKVVGLFFGALNVAPTLSIIIVGSFDFVVGSSISGMPGLYIVVMKVVGSRRRVFQLLDHTSSMPKSGDKCPLGSISYIS